MDNKLLKSAVAVALGTATVAAHAGGWYVTAGGGEMFSPLKSSEANNDWTNALEASEFTLNNTGSGVGSSTINNHVGIWRAGVGFQIIPVLGVEAEYLGLGTAKATFAHTVVDGPEGATGLASYSRHAYGVSAIAKLPLPVSPFIRAGLLEWTQNATINGTVTQSDGGPPFTVGSSTHSTGSSAYGGIGVQYGIPVTPVSFRLEWDTFKVAGSTPSVATLSVIFSF
jgi:hypothetical protein